MSKQAAGGERPSRPRATNAVSGRPPSRHLSAGARRSEGAPRDGAGTSTAAAMEARQPRRAPNEYVTFREGIAEASVQSVSPDEADAPAAQPHGTPWYVAPGRRRQPQPRQAVDQPSYPYGSFPADQERRTMPGPVGAPYGSFPADQERRTMPGPVGAPPRGPRAPPGRFTSTKIERVSTLKADDGAGDQAAPPPGGSPPQHHEVHDPMYTPPPLGRSPPPHHGRHREWTPNRPSGKSPTPLPMERKKNRPGALCFTACCILFWLIVIAVGVAVLVVYLLYHPKPPRLRVEDAILNAGYIDELPRRRLALNSDLSVLAAIFNPNTKIDIVMRYMELDLYFEGNMIGTTAVWPAPLHEGPRGYVLRDVRIVVSEVVLSREDAMVWQNATSKGGPVVLHLAGRFHAQLNFGRWLPFRYWIYPRCTLWLDPPPSGTLRRVRC